MKIVGTIPGAFVTAERWAQHPITRLLVAGVGVCSVDAADAESGHERVESPVGSEDVAPTPDPAPAETRTSAPPTDDSLAEALRQHLEDEDLPPKTVHGRNAIYPEYADEWSDPRTMWNSLSRYLPDTPGIEKGSYGSWTYTGDDAVRKAIGDDHSDALDKDGPYDPTDEF